MASQTVWGGFIACNVRPSTRLGKSNSGCLQVHNLLKQTPNTIQAESIIFSMAITIIMSTVETKLIQELKKESFGPADIARVCGSLPAVVHISLTVLRSLIAFGEFSVVTIAVEPSYAKTWSDGLRLTPWTDATLCLSSLGGAVELQQRCAWAVWPRQFGCSSLAAAGSLEKASWCSAVPGQSGPSSLAAGLLEQGRWRIAVPNLAD